MDNFIFLGIKWGENPPVLYGVYYGLFEEKSQKYNPTPNFFHKKISLFEKFLVIPKDSK